MTQKEEILLNLSIQKVELAGGSVSDIRKSYEAVKSEREKVGNAVKSASNAATLLQQAGNLLNNKSNQFLSDMDTFKKTAQNLGLDIPSDLKSLEQAVKGDLKTADNLLKASNKIKAAVQ
jgi:hypothetical protein